VYDAQIVEVHNVCVDLLLDQHFEGHPRDKRHAAMIAGHQVPDDFHQHGQPTSVMITAELEEYERVAILWVGLYQTEHLEHLGHGV